MTDPTTPIPRRVQHAWAQEIADEKRAAKVAADKATALAERVEQAQATMERVPDLADLYTLYIESLDAMTRAYVAIHEVRRPVEAAHNTLLNAVVEVEPLPPRLSQRMSADHMLRQLVGDARQCALGDA